MTAHLLRFLLFMLPLLVLLLPGCAPRPALQIVAADEEPQLIDTADYNPLITATVRHLHYLDTLANDTTVHLGTTEYSKQWLIESLATFLDILKQNPDAEELARIMQENFTLYQAGGRDDAKIGEMLFTGYYEPVLEGSLTRTEEFKYPLYAVPDSLVISKDPITGKQSVGRKDKNGEIIPFWSRKEIDHNNHLAGHELAWLNAPVDAFILHVQGSGKIRLRDKSIRSLHFAGSNGLGYNSIGKLLVDEEKLTLEEANLPRIRLYLANNPDDRERILHHNPRFIFFHWSEAKTPVGSLGEELTPGRSIAIDPATLPTTTLAFLITRIPVTDTDGALTGWQPFQRFVLPQDSGSAIKGAGRADIFWGNGRTAAINAGLMKEEGWLFFLVKNGFEMTGE